MRGEKSCDFELFKSSVCHCVKRMGDLGFLSDVLGRDSVQGYFNAGHYKECFYVLGMIDYLCRIHDLPLCEEYEPIRQYTLSELVYPRDILLMSLLLESEQPKEQALAQAIPEFLRHNIVEGDIRDVV